MTIVLITSGKGDGSADSAAIKLFKSRELAEEYIKSVADQLLTPSRRPKYWTNAAIVEDGVAVELDRDSELAQVAFAQDFLIPKIRGIQNV